MGFDDAEVQILLEWKERGRAVLEENKLALAEMNAALAFRDALRAAGAIAADADTVATATNTAALGANALAQGEDAVATEDNAVANEQAGLISWSTIPAIWGQTQAIWAAIPAWLQWTIGIAAVVATLAPFVIIAGSSIVILTTFAVGIAGVALATAGATALMLGLGGAVLFLADKTGLLTNGSTGMNALKESFLNVANALGKELIPQAHEIIQWLERAAPVVKAVGDEFIRWLDPRLGNILQLLSGFGGSALGGLQQVASAIGAAFDKLSGSGMLVPMFQQLTNFGAGAIVGLIQNLTNLGMWFEQRLPTYGPIASQIFGAIGQAVQNVAYWWGRFSDWLASQWPAITDLANRAVASFKKNWDDFSPVLQYVASTLLPLLPPLLQGIADHFGAWAPLVLSVAAALLIAATDILLVADALSMFLSWVESARDGFSNFANSVIGDIRALLSVWNSLPAAIRGPQTIPLPDYVAVGPYQGSQGTRGGPQSVDGSSRPSGAKTMNITINGTDTNNAPAVASAVSRTMRQLMQG